MKYIKQFYHTPGLTDLDKMLEEAHRAAKGSAHHIPVTTIIHHHKYGQPCEGCKHDQIEAEEDD